MATLDAAGANGLNAWTWLDQTVYLVQVPVDVLSTLAELEAARMRGLQVDQDTFSSELEVVINERKLTVDNDPGGRLSELLFRTAFTDHPYGCPTIGWQRDLDGMTVDDARAFYNRYYAPDNATIIVVGDVEPDAAADVVLDKYGHLRPSGVTRATRAEEPEQRGMRRAEETLPISADRVSVAFKVPAFTHDDVPALLALDAALTAGQTGRLKRALRDRGYVAEVGAFIMPLRDPSLYIFTLYCRPGVSAEVAEAAFWEEMERVAGEGISEGELAMGIAQWQASTWAQLEDADGKAEFLGWSLTHTGDHRDGVRRIEAIQQVTLDDVQRVARTYLTRPRSTVVVGRPQKPPEPIEVSHDTPVTPAARVQIDGRPDAGDPDLPVGELGGRHIAGATLVYDYDPRIPLVFFQLSFPAGAASDPAGKEGRATLAARMLLRGTKRRDRRTFEEALEQLGASASVGVDADRVVVHGTALRSSWPQFASLLAEALAEPAYDPVQLDQLRKEVENELRTLKDDDSALSDLALMRAMYGEEHPYGRDPRGTLASIATIEPADLAAFHDRYLRAAHATAGLAGGFDAAAFDDVGALLEGIAGEPEAVPLPAVPPRPEGLRVVLVDKPDRTQATVRIGQVGLDHQRDDFPDFLLFNDGFGIGFGGRLMKEVRVQRGWSYFAYSYPVLRTRTTDWEATLAPSNEYAADAVKLVLDLIDGAVSDGLTDEELELARGQRVKGRPFLADTARKRLELELNRRRTGYDRLAATDRMEHTTGEEAHAAFVGSVDPSRLVVCVVSTADEVRAALTEKVSAAIEVVDYEDL